VLFLLEDVPGADFVREPSPAPAPAAALIEEGAEMRSTPHAPQVASGAESASVSPNVSYEHQRPATELDAQTREDLSRITSDVLSDLAATMRSPTYSDITPGQVIPQRVVARLDAQGVLTIELGRGFIPPNVTMDELNEKLLWFEKTAQEFLATEVTLEEVRILFNGETLDFYFPQDPAFFPG
jgi:hypothetical protein